MNYLNQWQDVPKSLKKKQSCVFLLSSLWEDRTFGSVTLWFTEFAPKEARQNPNVTSPLTSLCHVLRVSQPTNIFFFEDDVIQSFFSFNRKHSSIIRHNRLCTLRIVTVSQMTDRLRSVISAIFHTYIRNTRKVSKKWCWVRMEKTTWTDRVKMKLSQWGEWTRPFQVLPREQASLRCKGFI